MLTTWSPDPSVIFPDEEMAYVMGLFNVQVKNFPRVKYLEPKMSTTETIIVKCSSHVEWKIGTTDNQTEESVVHGII